jgi:hypothetical protein
MRSIPRSLVPERLRVVRRVGPEGGWNGITGSFWNGRFFSMAATMTLRVWTAIGTP